MYKNSTTFFIITARGVTTSIPINLDTQEPNWQKIEEPTLSVLQLAYETNKGNIQIIPDRIINETISIANPKGFYEKLIGVEGECSLFTIYQTILQTGLNPNIDSSSLNFAITVLNSALNNNDWTKPYAKPAYLEAYNILKMFLTQEQIEVIDQENINFNLV